MQKYNGVLTIAYQFYQNLRKGSILTPYLAKYAIHSTMLRVEMSISSADILNS